MAKNDYSGLSQTTYTAPPKGSGSVLTLKDFNKAVKYWTSKSYLKKEREEAEMFARGCILLSKALDQNVIDEIQYLKLLMSMQINGFLLVSPKMAKILDKVK